MRKSKMEKERDEGKKMTMSAPSLILKYKVD